MKHFTLLLLCSILTISTLEAQDRTTQFGKFAFSAGIGTVPTYVAGDAKTHVPAISLRAGILLSKRFTLSTFLGYTDITSAPREFFDGYSTVVNNKTIMFGLRSEMHREITEKVDFYGGLTFGFASSNRTEKDAETGIPMQRDAEGPTPYNPNAPTTSFLYSGYVGATYYFDNKFGAFAEAGYGISLLSIGVTMKM